jgi:glycosyltransferase involved in cell wall biosynthesis
MRRFLVVTPVLNGARYIRQALASIDAQTHDQWLHVVVDGGSVDGTLEIVGESIAREPRRRLLTGSDLGLYDGVFKGFDALSGEPADICFWINADDMVASWAFATIAQAFDETGADWITALPSEWDNTGCLRAVLPLGWYPRTLIRAGLFHPGALQPIQQESTFFTRRLLDRLPSDTVAMIRNSKLAGDFMLWRAFARFAPLATVPTMVSGFRRHEANASVTGLDRYIAEARLAGAKVPPLFLARLLRLGYMAIAPLIIMAKARQRLRGS